MQCETSLRNCWMIIDDRRLVTVDRDNYLNHLVESLSKPLAPSPAPNPRRRLSRHGGSSWAILALIQEQSNMNFLK